LGNGVVAGSKVPGEYDGRVVSDGEADGDTSAI
jgi:hypothetical protein